MTKKAVAYVSDIVLGQTGEVIGREAQKQAIRRYAQDNGIEIAAFFEDEVYNEDIISRPGIQQLLACEEAWDCVLVERVWSLSRQWPVLQTFLKELQRRGRKLEATSCLWDCVSQQARHYFRPNYKPLAPVCTVPALEQAHAARVSRPARLNFSLLKRRPAGA